MTGSGSPITSSTRACSSARWAPRGHLGGLAEATLQALLLLDAAGTDVVFLETVGAGQSEVEVMSDRRQGAARPDAGLGRLGAGAEGRDHGDSRRDRGQQDGSAGCEDDAERRALAVLALDPEATGRRRSCSPRRCVARASTSCGSAIVERRDTLAATESSSSAGAANLAGEVVAVATARARGADRGGGRRGLGARGARRLGAAPRARSADRRRPGSSSGVAGGDIGR